MYWLDQDAAGSHNPATSQTQNRDEAMRINTLKHEILFTCTVCTAAALGPMAVVSAATLIWVSLL